MQRPHSDEQFPSQVSLRTRNTRTTFQGGAITCTRVSLVNAAECLAENSGLPEYADAEFSARLLWYASDRSKLSVQSAVDTMKRCGGLAPESLCPYIVEPAYPYNPIGLLDGPSIAAWDAAKASGIDFDLERIAGKYDIARALALGSPLITVKQGGNMEHAFCISGYDENDGMEVTDSGFSNDPYFMPWSDLGPVITQVYKLVNSSIPMVAHPDYKPPTPARFADGVLTIPFLTLSPPSERWMDAPNYFKNVKVHFGADLTPENTTLDNPEVTHMDCRWKPASEAYGTPHLLSLFAVNVDGLIFRKVTVKGVVPTIVSYEKD